MTPFASQPRETPDQSAEALALLAQEGSLLAFSQLVDQYEARLFNFILRRVGNWSDAEELTQETFVRAWERIARYDPRWKFSTWLFTIGLRLAVSDHRARSRMRLARGLVIEDAGESHDAAANSDRELGAPTWALAQRLLTEAQHTALWLRYAEGLGIAEIARIMDRTQVSVRVTLFRAREALAREISAHRAGGECEYGEASAAALRALCGSAESYVEGA